MDNKKNKKELIEKFTTLENVGIGIGVSVGVIIIIVIIIIVIYFIKKNNTILNNKIFNKKVLEFNNMFYFGSSNNSSN